MKESKACPILEVFVTHVKPSEHEAYKNWASKIEELEKTFPGYLGVYTEPPIPSDPNSFIAVLQFDTKEHLEKWLSSKEREVLLKESEKFVENLEKHSLNNPFPGWFSSALKVKKKWSLVIKETMLVLLVLFPIIMLELKFLNPITSQFNLSVATFIGNALSVSLIAWPMMPICLYFLDWWLSDDYLKEHPEKNLLGYGIVITLYIILITVLAYL